ncbi:synaptobrevin-domain-containing protein [Triangularia verruculosa]|uniref:Synaptobrevin homolog YKT6 n=1 Tax=Triangularia verruculosa TaxID=2587418 RepID=A0AAN7AYF1_9PEZI|nr:synaptobrevin-domain-containing protein [Triangularia verruculosa]
MASSSTPSTPLLYSCIAYNTTILSESSTSASHTVSQLATLILPKIDHSTPQKLTYTHGTYHINYIAESPLPLTFLVISDSSSISRRISFNYLTAIRTKFLAAYPPQSTDLPTLPNYGCASFNPDLKRLMVEYGTNNVRGEGDQEQDDAIRTAQREIEDVRGIMTRNIEGLLERGERIDLLVDKTDRLGGSAREFRVRSRGLKRRMWWKNVKLMGLLGLVVVLILVTIVVSVKNNL